MNIESSTNQNSPEGSSRWIASPFWIGFWIVMVFGILFHLILPIFLPELFRDGITIYLDDPHKFHRLALEVASAPWSEFTFTPDSQFPAGILALLYKLTGIQKPIVLLPILGIMAGLTVRGIASCLSVLGVEGRWWPFLIGIIFTVTPTSISWMVYPHKDAFIVPGVILITWTFLSATLRRFRLRQLGAFVVGCVLVFTSKPYFSELFLIGSVLSLLLVWGSTSNLSHKYGRLGFLLLAVAVFGLVAFLKRGYSDTGKGITDQKSAPVVKIPVSNLRHKNLLSNWQTIPGGKLVNEPIFALAYTRERFLQQRSGANTNFHPEIHLKSALDTITYLPRAIQLSLMEPLPWTTSQGGLARVLLLHLVKFEMLTVYLSIIFLLFSGRKSWTPAVLVCVALSIPFLISLGIAVPNIGAINRYRFPFLILIKLAGLAALWNSDRNSWPGRLLMWVDPPRIFRQKKKVMFLVPDDETFVIQRLVMAQGIQKSGYDVHVACPDLGHAQKIRDLGFTFHRLDLNRGGLNPFADFKPFIQLVLFLAKERPDILHNVSIKPVIYGATAGTIVGLKKIVCLINGLGYAFEAKSLKGKIVQLVAKALYRNALALPGTRVIFQNPDDQAFFIKNKLVDSNKTILIPGSGVNMVKFAPQPQPQNQVPVVLFVGRVLWSKGIDELVIAVKKLRTENIHFTLRIVGQPDERNPETVPREYLEKLHNEGVVEWLGRQSDMPRFYREADIIVLPQQNREGMPLTLLEAASSGRAVISTNVPGCREVVVDGVNGILVPPKDSVALTAAIKRLLLDPELRKKMGEAGSKFVSGKFSSDIIQARLIDVYESLLADDVRAVPVTI